MGSLPGFLITSLGEAIEKMFPIKREVEPILLRCDVPYEYRLLYRKSLTTHAIYDLLEKMNDDPNASDALTRLLSDIASCSDQDYLSDISGTKLKKQEARKALANLKACQDSHMSEEFSQAARAQASKLRQDISARGASFLKKLDELRQRFLDYISVGMPQERGYALEEILFDVFLLFGLSPRGAFRRNSTKDQIDGAFSLGSQRFLLEAKWTKEKVNAEKLRHFDEKVRQGLDNTLGLLVSINGVTADGIDAYLAGKRPVIICMDGADIMAVLENRIGLSKLLNLKMDAASQERNLYLPVANILQGKM